MARSSPLLQFRRLLSTSAVKIIGGRRESSGYSSTQSFHAIKIKRAVTILKKQRMRGKAERRLVSELTLPDALETFFKFAAWACLSFS